MTRPVLCAVGALFCFASLPALAAGQSQPAPGGGEVVVRAPPAPPAPPLVRPMPAPRSPTAAALNAATTEIIARRTAGTYAEWLATLPGFRFSPATSKLLVKQLGTDKLFVVKRHAAAGGAVDYLFTVPAVRRTDPDGSAFSWDAMQAKSSVAADGITIANQFNAPRITVEDKTTRVDMRAISASGTSVDTAIAYGDMTGEIGNVQLLVKATGSTVSMDGLFGKFGIADQGATVGMYYETGIRTMVIEGERIDDLHLSVHVHGLDKAALEKLGKFGRELDGQKGKLATMPSKEARDQFFAPFMRQLGVAVTTNGAAIDLDDLSVSYRGNKARMHGQLHLENVTPADLDQPAGLFTKVAGHAEIEVPLAMLRGIAENIARKQLAKTQPGADAAAIEKVSQPMYEGLLRQAVASGYVRVEGDMLLTSIDIRDGVTLINGKPFQMPKPAAPVAAVNSGAGLMRARRIADKCALPDFPPEVVAQDRALAMLLRLTVNADGSVANLVLARSSGFPDYDKAVLAAAARCTYIPALKNGKPIAVPATWEVVRAPGSARP